MVAKINQELKRERKRIKRERIDKATNGYMINLAWGILVIILLRFVESGYSSSNTILQMPAIMKTFAGIFAALAVGLFVCSSKNLLGRRSTFSGYAFFSLVLALGSLWIGFYASIRNVVGAILPSVLNLRSDWWYSKGPIVLVVAYLVVTLIWTAVRVSLIEKGKLS